MSKAYCLIIDHKTSSIKDLERLFKAHNPKTINYRNFDRRLAEDSSFIVLSGGPIHISDEKDLVEEKKFITQTTKPVFGVCLGLEIIGIAFGFELKDLQEKRRGFFRLRIDTLEGPLKYSHECFLSGESKEFDIIKGDLGFIEGLIHKTKPIMGVQGHPELSGNFGEEVRDFFIERFVKN